MDWLALSRLVDGSTAQRVGTGLPGFRNGWQDGERYVRDAVGGARNFYLKSPDSAFPRGRLMDACNNCRRSPVAIAREVKTGYVGASPARRAPILRQIEKDSELLQKGRVRVLEWHFVPNGKDNTVGAHPDIVKALQEQGVPFAVYPPGT